MIVRFDHENKKAQVSLRAEEILQKLNEEEAKNPDGESLCVEDFMKHFNTNVLDSGVKSLWRPEYAAYMVRNPYYGQSIHFFLSCFTFADRRHSRKAVRRTFGPFQRR